MQEYDLWAEFDSKKQQEQVEISSLRSTIDLIDLTELHFINKKK